MLSPPEQGNTAKKANMEVDEKTHPPMETSNNTTSDQNNAEGKNDTEVNIHPQTSLGNT